MTELTKYICDLCGAEQELNTSPQRMETNYVRFIGMISNLARDLSIQSLCPDCARTVGEFIKMERKSMQSTSSNVEMENKVSTNR